ncbi:hypothetical protein HPB49_017437 [Dermacentor silvarum]|uniref:Uncharacterized protein n=1 Tax=Dermacentor silvarum TaxID=543639 RepID=A0ACB8DEP2_DERSI|nr:hypothetical protein HPB49_017437 [Dermacentor silvarum]
MRVASQRSLRPSSTEVSSLRDARSSSIASSLQDTTSIKTASSLSDGSGVEVAAALADSAVGDRPRRSFLQLSLAATVGIFALLATAALAFSVLWAGSAAFQEGIPSTLDATDGDQAVVDNRGPEVGAPPAPKPQIKYGFEDEPVHWGESVGEGLDLGANPEKVPNPRCGQFQFSFCSERKGGAYFDPTLASCLPISTEIVYVCNRSPNRFSSLHECRRSCVEAARPHRRCMATPQFSYCNRELTSSWWFSNGTHCEEWRFPLGMCPARGSSVFASARQCRENCLRPRDKLQCCHKPEPRVCAFGQLKYPYFAAVGFDGCFRCLEATASTLAGYQCLIGANRFDTIDACNSTCVDHDGNE